MAHAITIETSPRFVGLAVDRGEVAAGGPVHGPYVELFSRAKQARIGWSYWGDESLGTAEMEKR